MGKKEQAPALAIFVQGSLWVWSATILWHRGTPTLNFLRLRRAITWIRCFRIQLSHAFIRHSPEDQSLLSLSWSVLIYAQICVLRALDGEFFFASGAGPLAAGLDKTFVDVG